MNQDYLEIWGYGFRGEFSSISEIEKWIFRTKFLMTSMDNQIATVWNI